MNSICSLNDSYRVHLGCAVTFMKYLAGVVSSIFLSKTLIWNKITFRLLNLLNLREPMVNHLTKSISKKKLLIFLFLPDLSLLILKTSGAYN